MTQAGRWIKFTSLRGITALQSTLRDYLYEAIALEESGKKVALKKSSEYAIPEELQTRLDDNAVLRVAFEALTPGRRFPGLKRLRIKSLLPIESGPQRLKPDLFSIS
jgi:uncharacterized protein YdeI (YjbR/CyaY-like superfamily)